MPGPRWDAGWYIVRVVVERIVLSSSARVHDFGRSRRCVFGSEVLGSHVGYGVGASPFESSADGDGDFDCVGVILDRRMWGRLRCGRRGPSSASGEEKWDGGGGREGLLHRRCGCGWR